MVNESVGEHFGAVLRTIDARRREVQRQVGELQRQLREIETTISTILQLAPSEVANNFVDETSAPRTNRLALPDSQKYTQISSRWAILWILNEVTIPMSIQEIALALQAGGFHTEAANFNNIVSAVLSRMKSDKGEVDVIDGKYTITEVGRSAIAYIQTRKLRTKSRSITEAPTVSAASASSMKGGS
jgi:hypothetical protein